MSDLVGLMWDRGAYRFNKFPSALDPAYLNAKLQGK